MIPLIIGTLIAVSALCVVLWPLLAPPRPRVPAEQSRPRGNAAIEALREVEFDRATGKLSEADYDALKTRYTARALSSIRAGDAAICDRCGPRPEPYAAFCSTCGASLAA